MTPAVKKGVPFQQEKTPTEWELEGYALRRSYQTNGDQGERDEVQDVLESYVREGAQQMLAAVLEEEVNAFLGRLISDNYFCRLTTTRIAGFA